MFDTKKIGFSLLAAGVFAASLAVGTVAVTTFQQSHDTAGAHAAWVSTAQTVEEQTMEADLIVRVQAVQRAEPRHLWHPAPDGAKRGTFAFTDTEVEVLEVYRGQVEVGDRLWVMQTGGDLITREGEISRLEIEGDALYEIGSELVLFLKDISGDPVHAASRSLFVTVNPAGRYQVDGTLASRVSLTDEGRTVDTDLPTLESEILAAVHKREGLENVR